MDLDNYVTNIESTVDLFRQRFYNLHDPNREKEYVHFCSFFIENLKDKPDKIGLGRLFTWILVAARDVEYDIEIMTHIIIITFQMAIDYDFPLFIYPSHFESPVLQETVRRVKEARDMLKKNPHYNPWDDNDDGGFC